MCCAPCSRGCCPADNAVHELSIAQSVLEIACRHAAGRRIIKVTVRVGCLRQVVPDALTFTFAIVAQGTPAEGAKLELEHVPAVGRCGRCEAECRLVAFPLQCDACGAFDLLIVEGEELIVDSLLVEEDDDGRHGGKDSGRRGLAERQ